MKHWVLYIVFLCAGKFTLASDSIIVKKDARLDILTTKQIQINRKGTILSNNNKGPGYRIQVVSTNNREEAYALKSKLLQLFPDQKSYTLFQSPNFRVRLGNFVDKSEADRFKRIVEIALKRSVYVVRDTVELSLKEEDLLLEQ